MNGTGNIDGISAKAVPQERRYRITDDVGNVYATFRLKPGVTIAALVAKYIPIEAQDDWSVTEVREPQVSRASHYS